MTYRPLQGCGIVPVQDQPGRPAPVGYTMNIRGQKPRTKMAPTPGSKTQKRKANRIAAKGK